MGSERKKWLLVRMLVWALVIFVLCAMPSEDIPNPSWDIPHLDKLVHFGMFFVMAVLFCSELKFSTNLTQSKIIVINVIFTFIYGGAIEVLQQHVFQRSGDVADLLADIVGATVGCVCYPVIDQRKRKILGHFHGRRTKTGDAREDE